MIPPKANRKLQRNYDVDVFRWRHLVENYFAKIKEFRAIATRYDKTECSYAACWNLAATLIASRWLSTGPSPAMQVHHLPNRDRRKREVTSLKFTSAHLPIFFGVQPTNKRSASVLRPKGSTECCHRAQAGCDP